MNAIQDNTIKNALLNLLPIDNDRPQAMSNLDGAVS